MSVGLSRRRFTEYQEDQAARSGRPESGHDEIVLDFMVDDVDQEFERIDRLGVDWVLPPTTQPWGNRSMVFRDPEGNLVNIFSRPTAAQHEHPGHRDSREPGQDLSG